MMKLFSFDIAEAEDESAMSGSPMSTGSDSPSISVSPADDSTSSESSQSSSSSPPASATAGSSSPTTGSTGERRRRKKKRLAESLSTARFKDIYFLTGEVLGEGSYGRVTTCVNMFTEAEYAVKVISKKSWCFSRAKILKEIELYYLCQGQKQIIQLIEYFEEPDCFYLIFEKAFGGPLLSQIQKRVHFTEAEAVEIVRDLALALKFLHDRGIAHRDLKPENVLCLNANTPLPVKLCDFDLCSGVRQAISTPLMQSPVGSAEYMAPEVVNAFTLSSYDDYEDELTYDKKCDMWSLGIITYILLCGYLPFSAGSCGDECGWDRGQECATCQNKLFDAIRNGSLVFPEQHWATISTEAKDLIQRLLVREASLRLDAGGVLSHAWIVRGGASNSSLETPSVLRRQTSVKEFSDFATNALAIKRNLETNPSFSRAFAATTTMKKSATSGDLQLRSSAATTHLLGLPKLAMLRQTSMIFPEESAALAHDSHGHLVLSP
jgi:MAP kinase interacting serine/threonine kinase